MTITKFKEANKKLKIVGGKKVKMTIEQIRNCQNTFKMTINNQKVKNNSKLQYRNSKSPHSKTL